MSLSCLLRRSLVLALLAMPTTSFADRAPPPSEFQLEGHRLVLPIPLTFETGSDKLGSSSIRGVLHIANYLKQKEYISLLRIEGHVAKDTANAQLLSEQRALAVARALVAEGVDCKRLLPVGFGDNKPVADSSTPEGRAQNTRIEPINAQLRGKAIGGMPADGGGRVAGDPCSKP